MPDEQVLSGGLGSGGAVVRAGDTVRRPVRPFTATVDAFLAHLASVGFDGAPQPLGTDEAGRSMLTWVDGDVAVPPFPEWAADDDLLQSVGTLQRRLHDAARSFVPPLGAVWDRANLTPPPPDAIVCHNDLCVENVVVRGSRAVAFIDFDFAAPNDPLVDIAIAARHWVPLRDPLDIEAAWTGIDQVDRFGRFCDVHALSLEGRRAVVAAALTFLDRALVSMRIRAEAGMPGYAEVWAQGYPDQNRRSHAWVASRADALVGGRRTI